VGLNRRLPRALRLPGAIELPWARRRRLRAERGTVALGVAACGLTGAVITGELVRVWRARIRELPEELDLVESADMAMRETVAVAVAGYEAGTSGENALLNLLTSFSATFAAARLSTYVIRRRGGTGPLRDIVVGERHIHHFVPGIVLAFLAGGASVISRNEELDPVLAIPFGMGVALTLDESALLLRLDDVYWSEEGIVSVQITLVAVALLAAAVLATRTLHRGERAKPADPTPPQPATAGPASR